MRAFFSALTLAFITLVPQTDAVAQDQTREETATEIAALRHKLETEPKNVDVRFALALRLSWLGELAMAQSEATIVIEEAPQYWDAHVLWARVAAWESRFQGARDQVELVLASEPKHVGALRLAVDIEMWAARPKAAKTRALRLLAVDDSADSRFRLARAAELAMHPREMRHWAKQTLSRDSDRTDAKALLARAHYLRLISVTEVEAFPIDENGIAVGELIAATLFPAARWSVTAAYDYRLRFGTDNHRGSIGGAYRFSPTLAIDGSLRAGSAVVVPELSANVGVAKRFHRFYGASMRYLGDKMPWPGQLHRLQLAVGAGLPLGFEVSASYDAGVLRYCGDADPVQGLGLRGDYTWRWLRAGVSYGFGMELDRAPLPPFVAERFGDDVCAAEGEDGIDLTLNDTRAQFGGGYIGYERQDRFSARLGYTAIYRLTDELVHAGALTLTLHL